MYHSHRPLLATTYQVLQVHYDDAYIRSCLLFPRHLVLQLLSVDSAVKQVIDRTTSHPPPFYANWNLTPERRSSSLRDKNFFHLVGKKKIIRIQLFTDKFWKIIMTHANMYSYSWAEFSDSNWKIRRHKNMFMILYFQKWWTSKQTTCCGAWNVCLGERHVILWTCFRAITIGTLSCFP